ncbi:MULTISPECIES: M56 family metallopeptidase [unclassified Streptomyces]|uniref:M56 family metallopeptidase n=1 Tax=unclassified Streptomyces TaxID=2593676 RepID=UPI000DBA6C95|nr:M56 family metallopeptidase [Streptomyces sp. PsTaAH-137]MYT74946.1 M48 family metalloprotease [Streptomyces sp. SID8367]RAJ91938.1 peptidase M48-like protein [Streptomyces sp. PsTaAH-137]
MTYVLVLVVLALAVPWGGALLARRLAGTLPPREACWALTGATVLLAGGTVAALIGLFHVPFLASLEQVPLHRVLDVWPAVVPFAAAAGLAMSAQLVLLLRRWFQQRSLLRHAWRAAGQGTGDGDLLVIAGNDVDAFALPGYRGRAGRVVVTAGTLRTLKRTERDALMAHERAHLTGRHHLLSAVVDLAAVVHPALRSVRASLSFHLERWADEAAAEAVGDRKAAAAAIARAALARSSHGTGSYPLLSAARGPVPRRVEALLGPAPSSPTGRTRRRGAAMATTLALAALGTVALAYGLHEYVEYAAVAVRGG